MSKKKDTIANTGYLKIPDRIDFIEPINANTRYEKRYDQMLLDHLSKGLSFSSFDVEAGVANKTLFSWLKKQPSFFLARERGEKKRLQLLEAAGIKMIIAGNAQAWKFLLSSDYGMSEKLELSVGRALEDETEIENEMQNITPERKKRLARIKELGRKLERFETE